MQINLVIFQMWGGSNIFSIFKTMNDAYNISQIQGKISHIFKFFYLATLAILGVAISLSMEDKVGNF